MLKLIDAAYVAGARHANGRVSLKFITRHPNFGVKGENYRSFVDVLREQIKSNNEILQYANSSSTL